MIETFDGLEQGTPEWFQVRSGIPTASEFATVMAKGRDGGESKTRKTYMYKLAGELITGQVQESYNNHHMERGKEMEAEARDCYAYLKDLEPQRVGFIRNGKKGCSPDSLIETNGMLEVKTALPHVLIEALLREDFPPEHKAQCQGGLLVAEREWIDIIVYWPKMPPFIHRAHRDEAYMKTMVSAIDQFNDELQNLVEKLRKYQTT
jgi:hypothetical protein